MLTDGAAVEDVLLGPGGAAPALAPGTVIADMSTIGPDAAGRVRRRLPEGVAFVDAPVSGSVPQAEAGELVILAGGTEADVARCAGALEALGRVRHVGPPGAGAALKLVLNGVLVANFAVLGEALAVADRLGVDTGLALDALSALSPQAGRLKESTPDETPRFTLGLAAKDLRLALNEARTAEDHMVEPTPAACCPPSGPAWTPRSPPGSPAGTSPHSQSTPEAAQGGRPPCA